MLVFLHRLDADGSTLARPSRSGGRRARYVVFRASLGAWISVVALVLASFAVPLQSDSKDEEFDTVDPYTSGASARSEHTGYVGHGPFTLWDGVTTTDVEAVVGRRLLWVETAHFKLGSTLETYRTATGDPREERKLGEELKQLKRTLQRINPATNKLDPWLRLHLFAARLEFEHAEFVRNFPLLPADFPAADEPIPSDAPRGRGPYLGQARKQVVLLLEKRSHYGRVNARWFQPEERQSARMRMPGGGMLSIVCAEALVELGYRQDSAVHSVVAADLAYNFVDGLQDKGYWSPLWFKTGLAHVSSRRIDAEVVVYGTGTLRQRDRDAANWESRVLGLVANDYATGWMEMMACTSWEQLTGPAHMILWSRVTWMLSLPDVDRRAWILGIIEPFHGRVGQERDRAILRNAMEVMQQSFGRNAEQMDADWRRWVRATYKR